MSEFDEIAHSGGKVNFSVEALPDGRRGIRLSFEHTRGNPVAVYGVYALPPNIPIEEYNFTGIGPGSSSPSIPTSVPVFIVSDIERKFGHKCPDCKEYWRADSHVHYCPYCGSYGQPHQFLSDAQRKYIRHYIERWDSLQDLDVGQSACINLDEISDATLKNLKKPEFYISDQRQQTTFKCCACDEEHDILGRFGHCSFCFTRNDSDILRNVAIAEMRQSLDSGTSPDSVLKLAVSAFENCLRRYRDVLLKHVSLTPRRLDLAQKIGLRKIESIDAVFGTIFDIQLVKAVKIEHTQQFNKMLSRRHVYEHNGGMVDQKYIDDTNDSTVKVGQLIFENRQDVHQFISQIAAVCDALHVGVHTILKPDKQAIALRKGGRDL
tara:strand:- start:179 stop:1315 length:1137 start_codon:yes stop_codon:yes gene_type:complete